MKIKDLPNLLTALRIIIVPIFIYCFVSGMTALCAVLFVISGLSDAIDGYVARRFSCESNVGKILDPIADKLTYAAVFFCLYSEKRIPLYFIVGFVLIQILQGCGALFVYRNDKTVVKSNIPGKIAGFSMFTLCFVNLVFYNYLHSELMINILCLSVLAIIACASAVYFIQYIGFSVIGKSKKN